MNKYYYLCNIYNVSENIRSKIILWTKLIESYQINESISTNFYQSIDRINESIRGTNCTPLKATNFYKYILSPYRNLWHSIQFYTQNPLDCKPIQSFQEFTESNLPFKLFECNEILFLDLNTHKVTIKGNVWQFVHSLYEK